MSPSIELIGGLAAVITSLCWLPQMLVMLRERRTEGVSLSTNLAFAAGVSLWLVYGVLISSWPVIAANVVTLSFVLAIIGLKLRYG